LLLYELRIIIVFLTVDNLININININTNNNNNINNNNNNNNLEIHCYLFSIVQGINTYIQSVEDFL
jgi:hypothetical protein